MKLKLCYKQSDKYYPWAKKRIIEPVTKEYKDNKLIHLFLKRYTRKEVLNLFRQLMEKETDSFVFTTPSGKIEFEKDSVRISIKEEKRGEKTESFSKQEVIEALLKSKEEFQKRHIEMALCEYLDELFVTGNIPQYLKILKDKTIENDFIDSEGWDVDIIKDKISIWFQFDEERLPEDEIILARDTLIKAMEHWYEFLQKKVIEGYEEFIEV